MKTKRSSIRSLGLAVAGLVLSASLVLAGTAPQLTPLLNGKWPANTRGIAFDVKVDGNYAYVVFDGGLSILDISNPTNGVREGRHATSP
ncbi:MAG: hypothetical protein WCT12_25825 [Verrucomicrobiota bacterium]